MRNLLTDVPGLRVGNAEDRRVRTGVTVVLPDVPCMAAVDVRGGAPGTRETTLLDPTCRVDRVDAIVLSGGSVFGLAAADAVVGWLAEQGRGLEVGSVRVPIVPGAILFDLLNGGEPGRPHAALARKASEEAGHDFALGNAGAGYGAKAGRLKGGLGSASYASPDGLVVAALVAANPRGCVVMPDGSFYAWPFEQGGEFGSRRPTGAPLAPEADHDLLGGSVAQNTSIGVVATNAALTKADAQRVAIMTQDGLARSIRPVHTPFDGDTIFVLATGPRPAADPPAIARIGSIAADCVARAVARGIYHAETMPPWRAWRDVYG
jgi:L-aminopeptidase/D-esterase-like protein